MSAHGSANFNANLDANVRVQEVPTYQYQPVNLHSEANYHPNANANSNVNVNIQPIHIQPIHVEPVHIEPVRIEPVNIHVEPVKIDVNGKLDEAVNCWETYKNLIPSLACCFAWLVLILNIFFPGLGTFVMACLDTPNCKVHCIIGFLQFLLGLIFIGWVWGIVWGAYAVCKCHGTAADIHFAVGLH